MTKPRMNHRQALEACVDELVAREPAAKLEFRIFAALAHLRKYIRSYPRGGHLAGWLRDGARCRLSDAREHACARGDERTMEVAGALLALTREQLEAVRRAAGVSADIGKVRPEGET